MFFKQNLETFNNWQDFTHIKENDSARCFQGLKFGVFNCRLLGTISHKSSSELYHSASAFNVDGLRGGGKAAFLNIQTSQLFNKIHFWIQILE